MATKLAHKDRRRIRAMRARGMLTHEVAAFFGVSCSTIYRIVNPDVARESRRRERSKRRIGYTGHDTGVPLKVPEYVLEERDRRMAMEYRDLTSALMGDPLR